MIDKDIEIEFLNAQLDYVTEQLKEERLIVEAMQEYVNAVDDYAVFRHDYEGCDERLTTWMPEDEAAKLRDSKTYFADDAKYILRKVNT